MALVHGVHRDHDHADLGRGVHERQPVGDVARPHAEVIAWAHADGEQAARQVVGALVELLVRPTQRAVGIHDELVIGIYSHLIAEVAADGLLGVQRVVWDRRDGGGRWASVVMFPPLDRRVHDGQELRLLAVMGTHLMRHDGVVVDALAGMQHVQLLAVLDLDAASMP